MFSQLLSYLLEASICLAVFYLFFRLLLQKEVFFVWNRVYILSALLLSLIIPVIEIPLQTTQTPFVQQVFVIQIQDIQVSSAAENSSFNWQQASLYTYLLIVMLLLGRLIFLTSRLWYLSGRYRSSVATTYRLVLTEGKLPTFSFFRLLFWDNSVKLSEEDKLQVFQHELTHIRQWHSADILFIEIIKAFFWFHPAVYLLKKSLQQVHEYLADAAVVQQHNTGSYIRLLVSQVLHTQSISFSTPFHQPPIKNRILMLQKFRQATPAFWKMILSLPVMAILIFLYSCQKSELEELQPAKNTTTTTAKLSTEDILNKYRSRYPAIELKHIIIDKSIKPNQVYLDLINVNNDADKEAIKNELRQAILAGGNYSATDIITVNPETPPAVSVPTDEIFQVVEKQPAPVGGYDAFYKYISENMQYPQQARTQGIQGKVFVQFVVDKDGSLRNVQILKGIGGGCDTEAVKVVANSPKWRPGKQNGQAVHVRMSVPIAFKLD